MFNLTACIIYREEDKEYLDGAIKSIPDGVEICVCKTVPSEDEFYKTSPIAKLIKKEDGIKFIEWTYWRSGSELDYTANNYSFASAKNACKLFAERRFVMFLDSDERVMFDLEELSMFDTLPDNIGGLTVSVHSYNFPGVADKQGVRQSIPIVRVFKNDPKIVFENRCHEQVVPAIHKLGLKLRDSSILIKHLGYYGEEAGKLTYKMLRNTGLLSSDLKTRPQDPYLCERCYATLNLLKNSGYFDIASLPDVPLIQPVAQLAHLYGIELKTECSQLVANISICAEALEFDPTNKMMLVNQLLNLHLFKQIGGFYVN